MTAAIGKRRRAIAEGYIPPYGHGPEPEFASHETAYLLNVLIAAVVASFALRG
jgi:hypothetical protein